MAARHCHDAAQARRLLAIALMLEGRSRKDATRQTGMDRQAVRDWVHRRNAAGVPGLQAHKPQGRSAKLTSAQMTELRELVVAGSDPQQHKVIR